MKSRKIAILALAALAPIVCASTAHAASKAGNYYLINDFTQECADLPGTGAALSGTAVWQDTCLLSSGSNDNQVFGFEYTRTVDGQALYVIVDVQSKLCLDLPNYGTDGSGSKVTLYTCNPNSANDNQEWFVHDVTGNGDDEIENFKSSVDPSNPADPANECLDVDGWAAKGTSAGGDLFNRQDLSIFTCASAVGGNWGGDVVNGVAYDDHLWQPFPA